MSDNHDQSRWLTIMEACDYLKVSKPTLYNYMKDRRLPYYTLPGTRSRRIDRNDLDALLEPGDPQNDVVNTED